jgi:hypothetical protein
MLTLMLKVPIGQEVHETNGLLPDDLDSVNRGKSAQIFADFVFGSVFWKVS